MKIALVGGTGDIGTGFAVRFMQNHEIIIGSRSADKAKESANAVMELVGPKGNVWGTDNGSAVAAADAVVLCVPYEHLNSATSDLSSSYNSQLVVSPVVPMSYNGKFFQFNPPAEGSAAMRAKSLLPEGMRIVSAYHTICAAALQARDRVLKADVLICGDDAGAVDIVVGLTGEIKSLRPLKVGPLAASALVESLTPMLLNVARKNKIKEAGITIVSER
jgi:8-hydroxy-5-deazaflavin:NADPH oxidoreductase